MKLKYKPKSKRWFINRIGKRIYRDSQGKCCSICADIALNGLVISNEQHARYLADIDGCFAIEGVYSNYRDKK